MPDYYAQLLNQSSIPEADPVEQKRESRTFAIVSRFHGTSAVEDAERTFYAQARREVPDDTPEVVLPEEDKIWIVDLITHAGFANTNGEARRFIRGGAVRLDGEVIQDEKLSLQRGSLEGTVLQVGKRRHARLSADGT